MLLGVIGRFIPFCPSQHDNAQVHVHQGDFVYVTQMDFKDKVRGKPLTAVH
jgi:hypothetical protein